MDPKPNVEECRECDGCGWYEGGKALKTTCYVCGGSGVVQRGVASPSVASPLERATGSEPPKEKRRPRHRRGQPKADRSATCAHCGKAPELVTDVETVQWAGGTEWGANVPHVTVRTWYYRCAPCDHEWYDYDLSMRHSSDVLKATVRALAEENAKLRAAVLPSPEPT